MQHVMVVTFKEWMRVFLKQQSGSEGCLFKQHTCSLNSFSSFFGVVEERTLFIPVTVTPYPTVLNLKTEKEMRHSCILTRLIQVQAAVWGLWFVSEISINIYQDVLLYKSPGDDFLEKPSTQSQGSNPLSTPQVQHIMNSVPWART